MLSRLRLLLGPLLLTLVACGGDSGVAERIQEYTQGMRLESGFLPFYVDEGAGRLFLLLDESNSELLYQASLPRGVGSNDIGLDRGQQLRGGAALVRFEPAGDRVLLRRLNTRYRADSDAEPERRSAEEAFASSVLWGFPVVARGGGQRLVDATEFLLRDSHGVARRLKAQKEGNYSVDASRSALFLPRSRAFPRNTELESVVTLTGSEPGEQLRQVTPDPDALTVHMHHSFIALPEPGFRTRAFHPESGFWPVVYTDYASDITEPLEKHLTPRHRLQKRNPGAKKSEPVEPIVYHLDPGTPEPVRSALLEGARWWNQAFEAAGYENAFRVEMLPEDADPMDVRYNVIQWVHRATRGWSYGSSVIDPRTGEIIKGHVTLGSLRVRQDLLIARALTSPFGEDGPGDSLTSELALARIRQLSAHEVGHTLGLAHNFAASAESRASVMDYPYPRIGLDEEGGVTLDDAYASGIAPWDKRTILYGYGDFGSGGQEASALHEVLVENRRRGHAFISDADAREIRDFHPAAHLWDNGADPVAELTRLLEVRETALARFGADSLPPGQPYSDLEEMLVPLYLFHRYQVEAVGKLVGGVDYRYAVKGDDAPRRATAVPAARQAEALEALLATLAPSRLVLPQSLVEQIPPKALGYERNRESPPANTGALFDPLTLAQAAAEHSVSVLLHPERLARLALQDAVDPAKLSPAELFKRLHTDLLVPRYAGMDGAVHRRAAGVLLRHWRTLYQHPEAAAEVRAAAGRALEEARRLARQRARGSDGYADFYAFEGVLIDAALQPRDPLPEPAAATLPPGAPIGSAP
jgi:hypothetical protein